MHASGQAWTRLTVLPLLAGGLSEAPQGLPRVSGREYEMSLSQCEGPSTLLLFCWGHSTLLYGSPKKQTSVLATNKLIK